MKLKREPEAHEIIDEIKKNLGDAQEVVFCGYGEPFMRFDVMKAVAVSVRTCGKKVRINTTGLGNLINGRDVLPELEGVVDAISVSLNASNSSEYQKINRSVYGKKSFEAVLDFVREAKKHIPEIVLTAVGLPGLDIGDLKALADSLGVQFRARPYLNDYENR